ncbi:tetratricopeptide repeat protein [Celeribacter halophilus]|jgi:Flp pilus assembly protein TadD|uniref:Tetratricopeptide repeat protein n=1 Tax=Celeribacter halophilus TaxID=576117 RepID=A0AAW7XQ99_9RHOB|nr:tetratricopeptide repeat protein [Celeribacter halophilus]MBU2889025.1 tetratricopeptide repeat protein [Celeribacter halophilus]MDO6456381.1 tetratricopeptide repeat protein [Celeribacter halophilus]MDO6510446.1 tetratricopeptide repeat protein [Celeribacter halophilus]MDO6722844.1 tetratricopeptide repeat protein [Celeribacter halophilus]
MSSIFVRKFPIFTLAIAGTVALSACQKPFGGDVRRADTSVNAIDGTGISDVMLNAADPAEAVSYFSRSVGENPDRIDLRRGLAKSLIRAGENDAAVEAWKSVIEHEDSTNDDKVDYADALIRTGEWKEAEAQLDSVPPTHETYKRYRLEAMIADSNQEWKNADSFYQTAVGLTTRPSGVLNNWGYSKMTRGEYKEAEKLFAKAITYDPTLFTAKNNLVLARGAQGNYDLPVMEMTQTERAQLLYTLGLTAVKSGDVAIGKGLIKEAIDTHPQHFEAAVRSLRALEANVSNG